MKKKLKLTNGSTVYFAHVPSIELLQAVTPSDSLLVTTRGLFKVRKNGRLLLCLDWGKDNEEYVKVTPIVSKEKKGKKK